MTKPPITIAVGDPALARAIEDRVAAAVAAVTRDLAVTASRVVDVRSRKGVARRGDLLCDAIARVTVTERNARFLSDIAAAARTAGALAIALVWDGERPPRPAVEDGIFGALEHARATPADAPVVLIATGDIPDTLELMIAARRNR